MAKTGSWLKKAARLYLGIAGLGATLLFLWLAAGWPILIDKICIRSEAPIQAEYIVCLGSGMTSGNLPTDEGWGRIYTAVQLYLDGYGNRIIFTGGGAGPVSETEIYAEAARWLGMESEDGVFEPGANGTADHPGMIMKIEGTKVDRTTPLNIVTSPLHSKRAALCFKKAGYRNFRLVTSYRATGRRAVEGKIVSREGAESFLRDEKKSSLPGFEPSGKMYNDVFFRLKIRTGYFFTALRELAALGAYKVKGYI